MDTHAIGNAFGWKPPWSRFCFSTYMITPSTKSPRSSAQMRSPIREGFRRVNPSSSLNVYIPDEFLFFSRRRKLLPDGPPRTWSTIFVSYAWCDAHGDPCPHRRKLTIILRNNGTRVNSFIHFTHSLIDSLIHSLTH